MRLNIAVENSSTHSPQKAQVEGRWAGGLEAEWNFIGENLLGMPQ